MIRALLATSIVVVGAPLALAAQPSTASPVVIATREAPPFAMRGADGGWTGLGITLWDDIATELGVTYELREYDLDSMLAAVADGSVAAAVAALTVTADRERDMDFSHPFYGSGLGIAVVARERGLVSSLIAGFFSPTFLKVLGALLLVLVASGTLIWIFERRGNPEEFDGTARKGLWEGFWWAAVTMTTVGYGDKSPKTVAGRVVALIWMFASVITISGFTAGIASALTLRELDTNIEGPDDLPRFEVGTVAGSTSEAYLRRNRVTIRAYPDVLEAMRGMIAGATDAVVYDEALLRYHAVNTLEGRARVLPRTFEPQNYAIALPPDSPLRESVNRVLLERIARPEWREMLFEYFGD